MNISEELIKKCIRGQQSAYSMVYKLTIPYAYSVASRYIEEKEGIKDTLQNTYAKTFVHIKQFNPGKGSFKYWFRRILVNECLIFLKEAKKLNILHSTDHIDVSNMIDTGSSTQMSREDIERYLKHIPEGYRTIFMLVVIDGYKHQEVAEMLSISKETSRSQLSRAKKAIQKQFMNEPRKKAYGFI